MFPIVLELVSLSLSLVAQFNFLELGLFTQSILPEFFSAGRSLLLYCLFLTPRSKQQIIQGSDIYFHYYNSAKTAHWSNEKVSTFLGYQSIYAYSSSNTMVL